MSPGFVRLLAFLAGFLFLRSGARPWNGLQPRREFSLMWIEAELLIHIRGFCLVI